VIAPWSIAQPYASTDSDVPPERFEAHLAALRSAGWRTITADALADALEQGRPLPVRTFVIAIDDGHDDGYNFAFPIIRRANFRATFYVIAGRVGTSTYLSWPQVREMQAAGMEIGNHTLDHVPLPTLAAAEVLRQVAGGQAAFEAQLDGPPTTFAYPFGQFDAVAIGAVRATGLRLAFTTKAGKTQTWATRLTLPRVHVGGLMTPAQLISAVNQFLPAGG
jgi:peptidoglycan/xylan/chitin deacetylase (PgdA/CDA1 family)